MQYLMTLASMLFMSDLSITLVCKAVNSSCSRRRIYKNETERRKLIEKMKKCKENIFFHMHIYLFYMVTSPLTFMFLFVSSSTPRFSICCTTLNSKVCFILIICVCPYYYIFYLNNCFSVNY